MLQRLCAGVLGLGCLVGLGHAAVDWQESRPRSLRRPAPAAAAPVAAPARGGDLLRGRPLAFERNVGQYPGAAPFVSRGAGYLLALQPTDARLHLQAAVAPRTRTPRSGRAPERVARPSRFRHAEVRMTLVGANPAAAGRAEGPREARSNYFLGTDRSRWRTDVQHFDGVRFDGVYPGIDVVYYGRQSTLEYDFIVQPGARPEIIELAFRGARKVRLADSGELVLETALGEVRQHAPIVYQERDGEREKIDGRYVARGDRSVGFAIDDYDASRPLVIDPVLEYSTYLGGSGNDYAIGLEVDAAGSMYVLGVTPGVGFPTLAGFDTTPNGSSDVFVSKFSSAGALIYSTFYGGTGEDTTEALAVDGSGAVYVAGNTTGLVPTTAGAFQTVRNGAHIFAFKLASSGNALAYATYLGSPADNDFAWAIQADAAGAAYIGGNAASAGFPTTAGAFDRSFGGVADGFVTKLNPAGSALEFSTFIGGTGQDEIHGMALDAQGTIYATGITHSCSDFPITAGVADATCVGGEGFITALQPTGAQLAFSTYAGGAGFDFVTDIVVSPAAEATIVGYTNSSDLPAQNFYAGGLDVFVARLVAGGSRWDFMQYIGDTGDDLSWAIAVDGAGAMVLAGRTTSANFPTTAGGFNNRPSGSLDAFLTKIRADGALDYSTYIGARSEDSATAIALDPNGGVYLAGWTFTTGLTTAFPVTANGAFRTGGGDYDAFLMRFAPPIDRHLQIGVTNVIPIPAASFVDSFADLGDGVEDDFGIIESVSVSAHVSHTFDQDLSLTLIGPDGTAVLLTQGNGGSGANYGIGCRDGERTTFDDTAAIPITTVSAPFRGTFRPQAPLSPFAGRNASGRWRLRATDLFTANTGAIRCWTLNIRFRAPIITGIVPANGRTAGGVTVTISGNNFTPNGDNSPEVRIGGVPVSRTSNSNTSFVGVTGARYGGAADVVVTDMFGRSTVARNAFTYQPPQSLTVNGSGTGTGTVTSQAGLAPAINCSYSGGLTLGSCVQLYQYGASITLTPTPTLGSSFAGWTGACTNQTGTCTVSMTQARTVNAQFAGPSQTLTVNGGTGSGIITSQAGLSPAINCTITNGVPAGACSQTYPLNTSVVLTLTPSGGSVFNGWSNACTGTGTCAVVMSTARTATASLTPPPPSLTITGAGTGSGVVTSQPGLTPAINCTLSGGVATGVCSRTYPLNTSITLSFLVQGASSFTGWGGSCSGSGSCVVTMNQSRTVVAEFDGTPQTTIETMTPSRGSTTGGTLVTIRGSGFVGGSMALSMDGSAMASLRMIDSRTMTFVTPSATTPHMASVVMNGPGGSVNRGFAYEAPQDGSIAGARNARFDYEGRYLVFESDVSLVPGDTNGVADIYVVDRRNPAAAPVRLSVTSQRLQAIGGESVTPAISSTGRVVAFASRATNLVPDDSNGAMDIFVHDRDADGDGVYDEADAVSTSRVSVTAAGGEADGASSEPTISGSGRSVAFTSMARNLGAGAGDATADVFVRDRALGTTVAVTNGTGASGHPVISLDGRFIAFESVSSALVAGDTNGLMDVFLHDRDVDDDGVLDESGARASRIISVASNGALAAGGASRNPSITQEGRWTVFESEAFNLVSGDTNGVSDVFIHDRVLHTTTRLSRDADGTESSLPAVSPVISANGSIVRYVRNPAEGAGASAAFAARGIVVAAAGSTFGDEIEIPDPTNPTPPAPSEPDPGGSPTSTPCVSGNGQAGCEQTPPDKPGEQPDTDFEGQPPPPPGGVTPVILEWSARRGYWNQPATIDIFGVGFGATSRVFAEGQEMVTELRGQSLRIQMPPLETIITSPVGRALEVRNGSLASSAVVFYYDPTPGSGGPPTLTNPVVDSLTVTSGPTSGGTPVTVNGSGFSEATVLVDGVPVAPSGAQPTALTVQMPPHGAGPVSVAVRNGDGVMAANQPPYQYVLQVVPQAPVLTGINPNPVVAAGGSPITITGQNFSPGATVSIGDAAATQVVVVSDTRIQALAPPLPPGAMLNVPVLVSVTADGRTGTLPNIFYYVQFDPFTAALADNDGDGLPSNWEGAYGLSDSNPNDAALDPDADGRTSAQEYADVTHPQAHYTRYFAEGASGSYFTTRISMSNPNAATATVLLRLLTDTGATLPKYVVIPAMSTRSVTVDTDVPGAQSGSFASVIESDVEIVVDRSMFWDDNNYGSTAETSVAAPALQWYLAEGATHGNFFLFYLLQNPSLTEAAQVRVRYLLPAGAPVERFYTVAPRSRLTIQVDEVPGLAAVDVSGVVESLNDVPIIAERAMYSTDPANPMLGFVAGHESAGVTAPATQWFLAEGATGPFFDLFVLLANPTSQAAQLRATYLLEDGTNIVKTYTVAANSRYTVYVNGEDPRLERTSTATRVESLNNVPVVVERAMWWPHGRTWQEAHNSAGSTVTGVKWGLAEGESGLPPVNTHTYILIANTEATMATVRVTLLFHGRDPVSRDVTVLPNSRKTVDVGTVFPESAGLAYGAVIESLTGEQIVVERAMYSDAFGVTWAAGTNALGTRLR
jgi:Tol biopolymer transport system component/subtilisin-like proprotein convertase family protein